MAVGAQLGVDVEHLRKKAVPWDAGSGSDDRLELPLLKPHALDGDAAGGNDAMAQAGGRGEDSVVADEMEVRGWNLPGEATDQLHRGEDDAALRRSSGTSEPQTDAVFLERFELRLGERRSGDIGAELFAASAIAGFDANAGVHLEAIGVARLRREAVSVDDVVNGGPEPVVEGLCVLLLLEVAVALEPSGEASLHFVLEVGDVAVRGSGIRSELELVVANLDIGAVQREGG